MKLLVKRGIVALFATAGVSLAVGAPAVTLYRSYVAPGDGTVVALDAMGKAVVVPMPPDPVDDTVVQEPPRERRTRPTRERARARTKAPATIGDPRTDARARRLGFSWPTGDGPEDITSPFGPRGEGFHHGTDIGCSLGSPILASYGGRVVWAGEARIYGMTVLVDHGNSYQTLYSHLSRIDVEVGTILRRGERLGLCGSTGRSTGPHLHFEMRYGGYVWDPLVFLP